jgi:hypothetical protein
MKSSHRGWQPPRQKGSKKGNLNTSAVLCRLGRSIGYFSVLKIEAAATSSSIVA